MNNANLLGRLTRDVEVNHLQNGTAVARFTLAVNRKFKNKQTGEYDADFINCTAFGKPAEIISQYVTKGQQLAVSGEIRTGSYENKEGRTIYTTEVNVQDFTFVSGQQGNQNQGYQQQAPQQQQNPLQQAGQQIDVNDDDLPF